MIIADLTSVSHALAIDSTTTMWCVPPMYPFNYNAVSGTPAKSWVLSCKNNVIISMTCPSIYSITKRIHIYIYLYITVVINYDFAEGGVNFINGLKWTNKKDNVRDLSACWNHQSHKKKTHTIKFVSFKWDLNSTIKSNTFHKLC